MKKLFVIFFLFVLGKISAQNIEVYPSNWWIGMKMNKIQLMVHADGIGNSIAVTVTYPGIQLVKVNKVENKNYVFLDVIIQPTAKAGKANISFKQGNGNT